MLPLIVKGFLPLLNGSAIMVAADVVTIAGSDFDIDKMYLRIPTFDRKTLEKITYSLSNEGDVSNSTIAMSKELRDNLMIDIEWEILTSQIGSEQMFNPGTFDTPKKMARIATITGDIDLLRKFAKLYGYSITDYDKIYERLREASLESLNEFLKYTQEENCPLVPLEFVYNHQQNMVGNALVGIYANGSSIHTKMLDTYLSLIASASFEINGRTIRKLDNVTNELGESILKNIAEFLNASVDNVKDPVLAKLLLNTDTADTMLFMLRAGLSIEEASLLFLAPLKKGSINRTNVVKYLEKVYEFKSEKIPVTNKSMTKARIDAALFKDFFRLFDYMSSKTMGEEEFKNNIKMLIQTINADPYLKSNIGDIINNAVSVASIYDRCKLYTKALKKGNAIMKADSPNNAIDPTLAGAIALDRAVELFEKQCKDKSKFPFEGNSENTAKEFVRNKLININMSRNEMRRVLMTLKLPSLQAFYSLGIELPIYCASEELIYGNTYLREALTLIMNNTKTGNLSKNDIRKFFDAYIKYALSKTELFGKDFDTLRSYYLHTWPLRFISLIRLTPELMNNPSVRMLSHDLLRNTINFNRGGKLSAIMKGIVRKDFNSLFYSKNHSVVQFAKDLFMYSYYHDGMSFGPNNFGYFFDSTYWSFFPEVVETIRTLKDNINESDVTENFIDMFLANNPSIVETIRIDDNFDGDPIIYLEKDDVASSLTKYKVKDYIATPKGNLYAVDYTSIDSEKVIYHKMPILNSDVDVYNANAELEDMAELYYTDMNDDTNVRVTYSDEESPSQEELLERNKDAIDLSELKLNQEGENGKMNKNFLENFDEDLDEEVESKLFQENMSEIESRIRNSGRSNEWLSRTISRIETYMSTNEFKEASVTEAIEYINELVRESENDDKFENVLDDLTESDIRDALNEDKGECKVPSKFK